MQLYQTLFNDRNQGNTETEQQREHDSSKRHVVATAVTVKFAVGHEMLDCLAVLDCLQLLTYSQCTRNVIVKLVQYLSVCPFAKWC